MENFEDMMDAECHNMYVTLTPPVSDQESDQELDVQDNDVIEVTCFQCLGEVSPKTETYHPSGYLKSKYFENVFENVGNRFGPAFQWTRLFRHAWAAHLTEISHIETLFLILRQKIGSIQNKVSGFNSSLDEEREEINRCLEFVLIQVRNENLHSTATAGVLLREIHTVLNHIGRISEIPQLTIHSLINKSSAICCYFHLHLDVYWRVLCMIHLIQTHYPDAIYSQLVCDMQQDDNACPVYDQVLHVILWDLVTVGQLRYNSVMKGTEYRKVSLFPCTCVQELWLLCIKLSQLRTKELNGEFFWLSVHNIVQTVCNWEKGEEEVVMEAEDCCTITNPPDMFNVDDTTSMCMWILSNITPLVCDNNLQTYQTSNVFVSNYHDLQTVLNKFLTNPQISESSLKRHLHTCLYITGHWEPNTKLLNCLWDYFYRRLNDTFQENPNMVDGLACVDKTIAGFYSRCKRLTSGFDENVEKETSFHLFLRILSQHLQKLYKGDDTRDWKQFKGRIYSKFYPRIIQRLTECGLYNLTCMFLTLGLTTNLKDLATKLCDFYDMVDFEHITFGKRSVIWRGAFTLMLICEDKQLDTSFIGERMAAALEHCVGEFNAADTSSKHKLWELVKTYLEGAQELVDMSNNLSLSEFQLIGPGIGSLLPVCSENQLRHVLAVIQSFLGKIRQVTEKTGQGQIFSPLEHEQHKEFADRLWKHVYRYIVDRSQTQTPPVEMADIAAEFCLLSLKFPPLPSSKDTFLTVFQTFAGGELTHSSVSCRFLGHLLGSNEVVSRLQLDHGNWESFVIRCWFQCCVLVPGPSEALEQVTRSVLQLSEVKSTFQQACFDLPSTLSEAPVQFLKALHHAHGNIKSWPEKMAFQQKIIPYFTDLQKCCAPLLRNIGPSTVLSNMYHMVGNMLKYCAKLVYIRQDPIVPSILSLMILPQHALDKDKPINPVLLAVIRDNLHLFDLIRSFCCIAAVCLSPILVFPDQYDIAFFPSMGLHGLVFVKGLGRLGYERDLFVQRKLKEIVLAYLPKFTVRQSSNPFEVNSAISVHPLVASLGGSFIQKPSHEAVKFRHYVMQVVVDNFLVVKNFAVHPQHGMGWIFLRGVVQRTINTSVLVRDFQEVLKLCLEYLLLLSEDSAAFPFLLSVLQHTAESHVSNPDVVPMSKVTEICQNFIKTYSRLNIQGVFKVMERLAVLHKQAVISVVRDLSQTVREIEMKRGVGTCHILRKKYYKFLQVLGDIGEEEIVRLQSIN